MTWNGFAESIGPVHSRSVDKDRMEENSVTYKYVHDVEIYFDSFFI
jgi:hypothetical protein